MTKQDELKRLQKLAYKYYLIDVDKAPTDLKSCKIYNKIYQSNRYSFTGMDKSQIMHLIQLKFLPSNLTTELYIRYNKYQTALSNYILNLNISGHYKGLSRAVDDLYPYSFNGSPNDLINLGHHGGNSKNIQPKPVRHYQKQVKPVKSVPTSSVNYIDDASEPTSTASINNVIKSHMDSSYDTKVHTTVKNR